MLIITSKKILKCASSCEHCVGSEFVQMLSIVCKHCLLMMPLQFSRKWCWSSITVRYFLGFFVLFCGCCFFWVFLLGGGGVALIRLTFFFFFFKGKHKGFLRSSNWRISMHTHASLCVCGEEVQQVKSLQRARDESRGLSSVTC